MTRFWFVLIAALCAIAGCHREQTPVQGPAMQWRPPENTRAARMREVREWLDMIAQAGLTEYAQLGREMLERGAIEVVEPPRLDARFNAWTFLGARPHVWLNAPMWERYPDRIDRATILLHELIHVRSGEQTHLGQWWSAQDEFRRYYEEVNTNADNR